MLDNESLIDIITITCNDHKSTYHCCLLCDETTLFVLYMFENCIMKLS